MTAPLDDRPFIYDISPDLGIKSPDSLPLIVVRRIYKMIEKDPAQTLHERYIKAFRIAITKLVRSHDIQVQQGTVLLTGFGQRKEVKAMAEQDSLAIVTRFKVIMNQLKVLTEQQA